MQAQLVPVAKCRASLASRDVRPIQVELLARSIEQVGLIQPIVVRAVVDDGFEVIAGMHRLSAFRLLGKDDIPAIIRTDDDLHAELALIDENLVRNELSPAERAIAISRRKAIYEALHPATLHGGTRDPSRQVGDLLGPPDDASRFTKATSDVTGRSERAIQRDAARGDAIGAEGLAKVVDTSLDKGDELDALAKLEPDHRDRLIKRAAAGEAVSAKDGDGALPNGNRTVMSSRKEPDDSLDFFPTPPWATRALIEKVFPQIGARGDCHRQSAWEPACGEGHMAEVLREYFPHVIASDIFDYGYGDAANINFLNCTEPLGADVDWIITNPPFADESEKFVLRALDLATLGVAMFVRLQWLETNGRYERIFKDHPPTLIAFFAERVNLCKGRWEPDGSTATAYIWLVWIKGRSPRAPFWIPPGCRDSLKKPDDADRFTTHPVTLIEHDAVVAAAPLEPASVGPTTDAGSLDDAQDIPDFLRRTA